ncbi:DUF3298 and DUF4163 domain-containing protein [Bacillus sp. ISL-47]|uniref:DUF3298 and DUF4163 domain-containing protein n=1 Tax=Bacillus sp. ISL-47 TaxID=2819130 RepID=UPI001BEB5B3D|nr:DUF3298 and DUF4163 domain-containing protein [Bacillus sp. ISL-47]MBT2706742.1 DUF3298 and DUF4163 domain-containing protein [Pseudomonas sp. ISL-84]
MAVNFPVGIRTMTISSGPTKVVYYPRVTGMQNKQLQHFINSTIVRENRQLINEQTGNMDTTVVDLYGYYEVKNNQRDVLSLSLNNYVYHFHAAHGMTVIKSLTFDLQKGTQVALKDLFKPGSDYVKRISDLIAVQIKERDIPLLVDFTAIKPEQDFYIADKALVVYFQLYEITPYAYGFPMFPISGYDLQDIIDENGSLGRMAVN